MVCCALQETSAQAYGRALAVRCQWLRQWRLTGSSRARQTALICEQIAAEKRAVWHGELKLHRSAIWAARVERAAREELSLHKIMRQIRQDERVLRATQVAAPEDVARWVRYLADEVAPVAAPLNLETRHNLIMLRRSKVIRQSPASHGWTHTDLSPLLTAPMPVMPPGAGPIVLAGVRVSGAEQSRYPVVPWPDQVTGISA